MIVQKIFVSLLMTVMITRCSDQQIQALKMARQLQSKQFAESAHYDAAGSVDDNLDELMEISGIGTDPVGANTLRQRLDNAPVGTTELPVLPQSVQEVIRLEQEAERIKDMFNYWRMKHLAMQLSKDHEEILKALAVQRTVIQYQERMDNAMDAFERKLLALKDQPDSKALPPRLKVQLDNPNFGACIGLRKDIREIQHQQERIEKLEGIQHKILKVTQPGRKEIRDFYEAKNELDLLKPQVESLKVVLRARSDFKCSM